MRKIPTAYLCAISMVILISCNPPSRLYRPDNKNKIYSGQLTEVTYNSLKQILTAKAGSALRDTIIIKYDYNNESCWNLLDERDDNYIKGFITRHKQRVETLLANRQNVSVFDFREPGNKLNKIIKWDTSIVIDTSKQLFNLIFKERSVCGNSIIVLPDRRFVFLRSDSHSEAMDLTQEKIIEYLKR